MANRQTIAVAALGDQGLDAEVSAHFGRCPFYALVVVEDDQIVATRSVANPYFSAHRPGVVPAYIRDLNADVILAGGMGPQAIHLFRQFGITVATGSVGRIGAVVRAFLDGQIQGATPCDHDHDHDHDHDEHH